MALLPTTVWVFSLSIPHGMHLVVPTHPCFFWAVCHPNRTFPQKSLSKNPRIGFPFSPPPDHTLLPLTHDPPPPVLVGYRLVKSRPCVCSTSTCVQNLPAAFVVVWRLLCTFCCSFLTSYGMSYSWIPHSLWLVLLTGWALFDCGLFLLQPTLLQSCYHFLLYYSTIPAVMSFDPHLLGFFGPAACSSLNDSVWSLGFLLL